VLIDTEGAALVPLAVAGIPAWVSNGTTVLAPEIPKAQALRFELEPIVTYIRSEERGLFDIA
jgi:hypothetical protein